MRPALLGFDGQSTVLPLEYVSRARLARRLLDQAAGEDWLQRPGSVESKAQG